MTSPAPAPAAFSLEQNLGLQRGRTRGNLRHAYDLALSGAIGGLFGLYLYVEMVQVESVYVGLG